MYYTADCLFYTQILYMHKSVPEDSNFCLYLLFLSDSLRKHHQERKDQLASQQVEGDFFHPFDSAALKIDQMQARVYQSNNRSQSEQEKTVSGKLGGALKMQFSD